MAVSDKDLELIDVLRENARMSVTEIADRLGVSRSTAQKRLDRLENAGVIKGYTVVLSDEHLRQEVRAHMSVAVKPRSTAAVIEKMRRIRAVREIHSVSGAYDLIVMMAARSVTELDEAIDELIQADGVERTTSAVILSTKFAG